MAQLAELLIMRNLKAVVPTKLQYIHPIRNYARLTSSEVSAVLRQNEFSGDICLNSIKSYDSNQLASNNPAEDSRIESRCLMTTGVLFGVFDGHGGPACGQVVAKRLLHYIAASILPSNSLPHILDNFNYDEVCNKLLLNYNDRFDLVEDLKIFYGTSFYNYLKELTKYVHDAKNFSMEHALERAFVALDADICSEAKIERSDAQVDSIMMKTLSVAISGSTACVAHVDDEHLHVANAGDCRAVLGSWDSESDSWVAIPISKDHNGDNPSEVARILKEHPSNEKDTVIKGDRLLGELAPLRSFGDIRFKWSNEELKKYLVPYIGSQALSRNSFSPPYLTAKPEICYHKLKSKDCFLILATDGLWDLISSRQAVKLVGEHMYGKTTLKPFELPAKSDFSLAYIHETLMQRRKAEKLKPIDANASTHLIRHALGGTEHGIDANRLSQLLTMPEDTVRLFRDDITASVIFFDTDYLRTRPL